MSTAHQTRSTLIAVVLAALVGAGCGSAGDAGGGATADPASSSGSADGQKLAGQAKAVKFAACMRSNGVPDFPDPDANGEFAYGVSVRPAIFTRAATACKDLQPPGVFSSKRSPKEQTSALNFADCVRKSGVEDFPDPVQGEPAIDTTKIPSTDEPGGMTILNAAIEKCRPLSGLAAGGQGG